MILACANGKNEPDIEPWMTKTMVIILFLPSSYSKAMDVFQEWRAGRWNLNL
ncbi:unnamed protein product [Brassica rapa subsp. narinosa]